MYLHSDLGSPDGLLEPGFGDYGAPPFLFVPLSLSGFLNTSSVRRRRRMRARARQSQMNTRLRLRR